MQRTGDFFYDLDPRLIAQSPLMRRDASRLLVLNRELGEQEHRTFADITNYLRPGDILVANDSRVIPARLYGQKAGTGGKVELLLLDKLDQGRWRALVGGKKLAEGARIVLLDTKGKATDIAATILEVVEGPLRILSFSQVVDSLLDSLGHVPLPPYIHEQLDDPERYQTVYAKPMGSVAAPTAGLHFTPEVLLGLREKGVIFETITLHVGLDTFRPVEAEVVENHKIHSEWAQITQGTAKRINEAVLAGGRLIAVGTSAVRVLESAALRSAGISGSLNRMSERDALGETLEFCPWRPVAGFEGQTDLFIYPGYRFRVVDAMLTNFHLPKSTLMMLVSAFAGHQQIMDAYNVAMNKGYRFYSFGDAMLIL